MRRDVKTESAFLADGEDLAIICPVCNPAVNHKACGCSACEDLDKVGLYWLCNCEKFIVNKYPTL